MDQRLLERMENVKAWLRSNDSGEAMHALTMRASGGPKTHAELGSVRAQLAVAEKEVCTAVQVHFQGMRNELEKFEAQQEAAARAIEQSAAWLSRARAWASDPGALTVPAVQTLLQEALPAYVMIQDSLSLPSESFAVHVAPLLAAQVAKLCFLTSL